VEREKRTDISNQKTRIKGKTPSIFWEALQKKGREKV